MSYNHLKTIDTKPDNLTKRMFWLQLYWIPAFFFILSTQFYFDFPIWLTVMFSVGTLFVWVLLFIKFYLKTKGKLQKLIDLGLALIVNAEILVVEETRIKVNKKPLFNFVLLVKNEKEPYQMNHSQTAPLFEIANLKKGEVLKMAIDPENYKLAMILWEK